MSGVTGHCCENQSAVHEVSRKPRGFDGASVAVLTGKLEFAAANLGSEQIAESRSSWKLQGPDRQPQIRSSRTSSQV